MGVLGLSHGAASRGEYKLLEGGRGLQSVLDSIDRFFEVSHRGSTLLTEVRGGLVGWMTTSYILVVNPAILYVASGPSGLDIVPLVTATAMSSAFGSLVIGLGSNMPFAMVPGMGLNAYFAYGICEALGVSYQQALSCSFVGGVILMLLSALGASDLVVRWVLSEHLKKAITAAIGMFQAMIGFQAMGLVVGSSNTLVTMGDLTPSEESVHLYLALGGLFLISGLMVGVQLRGSMLVGIIAMAAYSWAAGLHPAPEAFLAAPSFASALQVDFSGWLPGSPQVPGLAAGAAVLLFVCLFDVAGVQYGLQTSAGIPMGDPRSARVITTVGLSTAFGALCGTSPVIVATESSAAILEGARTGLAAVVMAVLFLASAVIAPVISAVPRVVTAVPLVVVGAFMMAPCRGIAWDDLRVALPSFLTLTVVPFTYSIHNGIVAGVSMDCYLALLDRAERWHKQGQGIPAGGVTASGGAELRALARSLPAEPTEDVDEPHGAELERLRRLAAGLLAERAILLDSISNKVPAPFNFTCDRSLATVSLEAGTYCPPALQGVVGGTSGTTTVVPSAMASAESGSASECETPTMSALFA